MKVWQTTALGIASVAVFVLLTLWGLSVLPDRVTYHCENITASTFTCTRR